MTAAARKARRRAPEPRPADWMPEMVSGDDLARALGLFYPAGVARAVRAGDLPRHAFTDGRGMRWWAKARVASHFMGESPQPPTD